MPQYILRDLPPDLWGKAKERAQRDGWPLRALLLQLLADYGADRLTPSASPPSAPPIMQKYGWLKNPFRRLTQQDPSVLGLDPVAKWARLRNLLVEERPHDPFDAELLERIDAAQRPAILQWLEESL